MKEKVLLGMSGGLDCTYSVVQLRKMATMSLVRC